jgi:hypothetical protein
MADIGDKAQGIVSPIQMVDLVGQKPVLPLTHIPDELIQEIAEASNAHSAIIITAGKIEAGKPLQMNVVQMNANGETVAILIEKTIDALITMLREIKK